jgi:hypothetical protein
MFGGLTEMAGAKASARVALPANSIVELAKDPS